MTSYRSDRYDEIRRPLYEVFPKEKCVDVFADYMSEEKKSAARMIASQKAAKDRALKAIKKILGTPSWQDDMTYRPGKTRSVFYLPYAPIDCIQQEILVADDYFERGTLDRCFVGFRDGAIAKAVQGKTIIDVGANIGNHSLYFANETGAARVISFEPVEETFGILERNVRLNHLEEKIEIHHCGLGERESRAVIAGYNAGNLGGTPIDVSEEGDIVVKTLDGFHIKDDIAFMKIDVEGMELPVLRGGAETIGRNHPFIMLEAFDREECADRNREVQQFLEGMGYMWERIDGANLLFY